MSEEHQTFANAQTRHRVYCCYVTSKYVYCNRSCQLECGWK